MCFLLLAIYIAEPEPAMLLRTISIKNAEQKVLNGAVLCSFAIPMLSRNFLAYSLNEGAEVGES